MTDKPVKKTAKKATKKATRKPQPPKKKTQKRGATRAEQARKAKTRKPRVKEGTDLNDSEVNVCVLLSQGYNWGEISEALRLGKRTCEAHYQDARRRLGLGGSTLASDRAALRHRGFNQKVVA
jgi:DNA-binding NarL/FixJ family response regulator